MKSKIFKTIKALGIGALILGTTFAMAGCNPQPTVPMYNETQVQEMIKDLENTYQARFNQMSLDANDIIEKQQIKIDALQEELLNEVVEEIAIEEDVPVAYFLDKVKLDGNFGKKITSDNFEKLSFGTIRYDKKDYDVEEIFTISSGAIPVYNIEDENEKIFLSLDKGSLKYSVKFSDCVELGKNDLEFSFLGNDVIVSDVSSGKVTFYQGEEFVIAEGESKTYKDSVITVSGISNDGKVVVKVSNNSTSVEKIVKEDETNEINGLEIYVKESITSDKISGFATLRVGVEDIELKIEDGDEYDSDDRFVWEIKTEDNKLCSIGLVLDQDYTDDEDLIKVNDSFCLPNDFLCVSIDKIENALLEPVTLDFVRSDRLKLSFDGKIEINDRRVSDVVYYLSDSVIKYKNNAGNNVEIEMDDAVVNLLNGDRTELFTVSSDTIKLGNYKIEFNDGEFTNLKSVGFNDEDNKLVSNGDVLYKVKDYDDSKIKIGLTKEDVKLVLKVE